MNDNTGAKARAAADNPFIMNNPRLKAIVDGMLNKK